MEPTTPHIGRNDPCHCGSGRKYKHCCLDKDEEAARKARAEAKTAEEEEAPRTAEKAGDRKGPAPAPKGKHAKQTPVQPWRKQGGNAHPVQRRTTPRKVGGG